MTNKLYVGSFSTIITNIGLKKFVDLFCKQLKGVCVCVWDKVFLYLYFEGPTKTVRLWKHFYAGREDL